jgi:Lon protease-like protein
VDPGVFDPSTFSGRVPIFPLHNVVLFPHAFLPLHVFEPRYRAMTADARAGEGLIAMAMFQPGWEKDYYGNPPVRDVIGIGKIVEHHLLDDGRCNIVLYGVSRARIVEEVSQNPYRVSKVDLLEDRPEKAKKYERLRRLLLQFYNELLRNALKGDSAPPPPPPDLPLGLLCDQLSSLIGLDAAVKQALLEDLEVEARCDRLVSLLESSVGLGSEPGVPPKGAWPPSPSVN